MITLKESQIELKMQHELQKMRAANLSVEQDLADREEALRN
jgi:hypothetical protein